MRKSIIFSLCAALALAVPAQAGTVTTNLGTSLKIWRFTADATDSLLITVTLAKSTTVVLVVVDTGNDPVGWCAGVSTDRVIRCEFSAIRGVRYAIGMETTSGRVRLQLNVRGSRSEIVARGGSGGLIEIDPAEATAGLEGALETLVSFGS